MDPRKTDDVQTRINDLITQIEGMAEPQRTRLMELARETQQRHEQLKLTFSKLHDGVDYLRLHVKYLLFDLDATRRENNELRKKLRDSN